MGTKQWREAHIREAVGGFTVETRDIAFSPTYYVAKDLKEVYDILVKYCGTKLDAAIDPADLAVDTGIASIDTLNG